MARYRFKAIDPGGRKISGVMEAETVERANELILGRGHIPTSVAELSGISPFGTAGTASPFSRVRPAEIVIFTKQFSTMLRAGVPMIKALEILASQTENRQLVAIVRQITRDVREGANLSDALSKYPKAFSPLYTGMIHAGETSGALPQIMDRLVYVIEHEAKIRADVKSALQYPALVVGCLAGAFVILLTVVVPKFVTIFQNANLTLPLPTRVCLALSNFMTGYWPFIVGLSGAAVVGIVLYVRTEQGRFTRDTLTMRVPIVGSLVSKAAISRFASVFAILQSSGVAVLESMRILSGTMGNAAISRQLTDIQVLLQEGHGIATPLRSAKYFTPMLVNMVAIGEETGKLDEMLRAVSVHYGAEIEYETKRLSSAIGPVLIIALAILVGFFALAIYMPMWDLAKIAATTG